MKNKNNKKKNVNTSIQKISEINNKHQMCALKGAGRIPVGCEACGGPYPLCCGSCPMFD